MAETLSPEQSAYVAKLVDYLSSALGVSAETIRSANREVMPAAARMLIMTHLRGEGWPLEQIGVALGRDHSTIHHGVQKMTLSMANEPWLRRVFDRMPVWGEYVFTERSLVEKYERLTSLLAECSELRDAITIEVQRASVPTRVRDAVSA